MLFISSLLSCLPQDEYAATPLMTASEYNHIEVARFLVEHGAHINYRNKVFNNLFFCFLNLLILLNLEMPPQYGNSPLQTACNFGCTDIVKLLIQSNADIELQNKVGIVSTIIIHHS